MALILRVGHEQSHWLLLLAQVYCDSIRLRGREFLTLPRSLALQIRVFAMLCWGHATFIIVHQIIRFFLDWLELRRQVGGTAKELKYFCLIRHLQLPVHQIDRQELLLFLVLLSFVQFLTQTHRLLHCFTRAERLLC